MAKKGIILESLTALYMKCNFCSIFEIILQIRLMEFFYFVELINNPQLDFKKQNQRMMPYLNYYSISWRELRKVTLILKDLSKAFDHISRVLSH